MSLHTVASTAREGVIIECPLIHLFHDARDVILTSRNDVRQLDDDDDDDEPTLVIYIYIYIYITLKIVKMTIYNVFDIPKRYKKVKSRLITLLMVQNVIKRLLTTFSSKNNDIFSKNDGFLPLKVVKMTFSNVDRHRNSNVTNV